MCAPQHTSRIMRQLRGPFPACHLAPPPRAMEPSRDKREGRGTLVGVADTSCDSKLRRRPGSTWCLWTSSMYIPACRLPAPIQQGVLQGCWTEVPLMGEAKFRVQDVITIRKEDVCAERASQV